MSQGSEIDSALQAALREPRERINLLKLEQALVDFVNSAAEWLEVGGLGNSITVGPSVTQQIPMPSDYRPATSFQRCVCHRLADRFHIVRENAVLLEGAIRLVKVPETRVPTILLQNVDVTALDAQQQQSNLSSDTPIALLTPNESGGKRPKMKLMKRKDSNTSASSRQSKTLQPNRSSGSLTDKERAYKEARARIFGSESDQGQGEEAEDLYANTACLPSEPNSSEFLAESSRNFSAGDMAVLSSSNSNFENKAIYRNRLEEAADPDFQRGVAVYAPAAAPYPSAVATAPPYPFVSPEPLPVMVPSSIYTTGTPGYYYSNFPSEATAASSGTTTEHKSAGLTADAPAFYPYGQSATR